MSTFQYHPAPKPTSGFTTRVVLGPEVDETALAAAVAAETGVPVDKVPLVFQSYLRRFLTAAATGGWSSGMFDLVRFRPTSGGSQPGPDDFHNADDINADVSLSFTMDAIRAWRPTLSLESLGTVGKVTPIIDDTVSLVTGMQDRYTAGGQIRLRGDNLDFDISDPVQGIFFTPAGGAEVRASFYGVVEPSSAAVTIPATFTAALTVRVAVFINGSVRSSTYTNPVLLQT